MMVGVQGYIEAKGEDLVKQCDFVGMVHLLVVDRVVKVCNEH